MRSMLNNHPAVYIAGETHYFDDLRVKLAAAAETRLHPGQERAVRGLLPGAQPPPLRPRRRPGRGWLAAELAQGRDGARVGEGTDA